MSTDKDWELWGKSNPYFGVLSDERFLGRSLNKEMADEFYASGVADVENLISSITQINHGEKPFFNQAVDFGCGVGRLTLPLSKYARKVTGLDVSPSMVKQARLELPSKMKNITYVVSDDELTNLPKNYDLVYSNIVLQHIPPRRGEAIIDTLLAQLQTGGYAALHVTYGHQATSLNKLVIKLRGNVPIVHYLLNVLRGRPFKTPLMRMHVYDFNRVLSMYYRAGLKDLSVTMTTHGDYDGAMIIGKKEAN